MKRQVKEAALNNKPFKLTSRWWLKNKWNILTVLSCAGSAMFFHPSFFVADCLATTSTPHSSPVPLLKIHTRRLGSLYKSAMFRREFCKSLGALFSLTKPSSTLLYSAQGTKTCKMALVTIPGMEVHGITNIKGQIQVMWCSRWRL